MRVLLIEDDLSTSNSISLMLRSEGFIVDHTDLGEDGLEIGKIYDYDIMILDIMLPDMDGFEVCRRLRQHETTRSIPVLFLTARDTAEDVVEGFRAGGVDYVVKPFRKEEVLARVRTQLERVQLLGEVVAKNAELEEKNRALKEEIERRERLTSERDALADRLSQLSELEAERRRIRRRPRRGRRRRGK